MVERLKIDHVGHRGDGVSLDAGNAVYVPYTLGGETVEVDHVAGNHPDRRKLLAVDVASPERVEPFCPHFGVCGGCAIQHWAAEPYQAWKRGIVVETLAQAGIDCEVAPLVDAHGAGRRRVTLHGRFGTHNVLKVGFAAASSHDVIPIHRCPILDPALEGALDAAWALAEPLTSKMPVTKPLDIQVTATANGLDVDVRGSGPLPTRAGHGAVARRRAAPPGAADAAWRAGAATPAADIADGPRRSDVAAGLVPAGNRRGRRDARCTRRRARRQGQGGRSTSSAASARLL